MYVMVLADQAAADFPGRMGGVRTEEGTLMLKRQAEEEEWVFLKTHRMNKSPKSKHRQPNT